MMLRSFVLCLSIGILAGFLIMDADAEKPQIIRLGTIDCDMVETTPVVFHGRLFRFEWVRPNYKPNTTGKPYFRFIDVETGEPTPAFAEGYHFGSAYEEDGTLYVTGTKMSSKKGWFGIIVDMFVSKDMRTWKKRNVLDLPHYEIFNTSLCKANDKYVLMFEIRHPKDEAGVPFTARFATSKDLVHWELTPPECAYDTTRYSAPHCLRYVDGMYYVFFVIEHEGYETLVVRSRDLIHWEPSPYNPIMRHCPEDKRIANPKLTPEQREHIAKSENVNNSDIDFCEYMGRTVIFYCWGNQRGTEFLAQAYYDGSEESFIKGWFPE